MRRWRRSESRTTTLTTANEFFSADYSRTSPIESVVALSVLRRTRRPRVTTKRNELICRGCIFKQLISTRGYYKVQRYALRSTRPRRCGTYSPSLSLSLSSRSPLARAAASRLPPLPSPPLSPGKSGMLPNLGAVNPGINVAALRYVWKLFSNHSMFDNRV